MTRTELPNGCYSITDEWGTCYYNSSDQFHRDGGLPSYEGADGSKHYYVNGLLHRDGGLPAIEGANGKKHYYVNDQRHNVYGPAYTESNGYCEYWLRGRRLTEAEWLTHPDVIKAKEIS